MREKRGLVVIVFLLFFMSGFTALMYQLVWERMLEFFTGVNVYAISGIVAAYMMGLGVGALIGGYLADRVSRRMNLLFFAVTQAGIALFAVISTPLYYDILYSRFVQVGQNPLALAGIIFISLLIPTFCMGVSLPLVSRALIHVPTSAAKIASWLYGINALGSAAGAYVTTWVLFRLINFEQICVIGAIINAMVALVSVLLLRSLPMSPERKVRHALPIRSRKDTSELSVTFPMWMLLYGISGFMGLSLEIIWFRMYGIMLKNTPYAFGTILTWYLIGFGGGLFLGGIRSEKSAHPLRSFLLLQIASVVYVAVFVILFTALLHNFTWLTPLWNYFGQSSALNIAKGVSDDIGLFVALYVVLPVLFITPATLCMGMSFPFIQQAVQTDERHIGRRIGFIQLANIVGSMLGVLGTGVVFLTIFGTSGTLKLLILVMSIFYFLWPKTLQRSAGVVALMVFLYFTLPDAQTLWGKLSGARFLNQTIVAEDATGVTVLRRDVPDADGLTIFYINGRDSSWVPYGGVHSFLGAFPVLVHPNPKTIAIIGLGSGDTLFHAGGRKEITRMVGIELVNSEFTALQRYNAVFPYVPLTMILSDPRIKFVHNDGRLFLSQTAERFDVIETDTFWSDYAGSGNLYSEEYFTLIKKHLNPNGLAMLWLPTPRSRATFLKIFPYVLELGEFNIGSEDPIAFNLEMVKEHLSDPFTRDYYSRASMDVYKVIDAYVSTVQITYHDPTTNRSRIRDTNTDLFPKDEFTEYTR